MRPRRSSTQVSSDALKRSRSPGWRTSSQSTATASRHRSDRKSTRLNSSHQIISYAVFCLKKNKSLPIFKPVLLPSIKNLSHILASEVTPSYDNFYDCLHTGITPPFSFADSSEALKLIFA